MQGPDHHETGLYRIECDACHLGITSRLDPRRLMAFARDRGWSVQSHEGGPDWCKDCRERHAA